MFKKGLQINSKNFYFKGIAPLGLILCGGEICPPPYDFYEKKFFAQFLLHTQSNTQNRVTHQKPGLYFEKQKKWRPF